MAAGAFTIAEKPDESVAPQLKSQKTRRLSNKESTIEPKHPMRLEKKKNMELPLRSWASQAHVVNTIALQASSIQGVSPFLNGSKSFQDSDFDRKARVLSYQTMHALRSYGCSKSG